MLLASAGPAATGRVRVGITASRKVGNAVARNRVKRAVRDWFRTRKPKLPSARSDGLDLVVIARRGATRLAPMQIAQRLEVRAQLPERRGRLHVPRGRRGLALEVLARRARSEPGSRAPEAREEAAPEEPEALEDAAPEEPEALEDAAPESPKRALRC